MKGLRFEPLQSSHLQDVLEVEAEANPAPWSEESFRHEIDNPQGTFLVAVVGSQVVAFGGIWHVVDEAHVTTVAVRAEYRRRGIAKALMVELLGRAKRAGHTCSTLEVRAGNPGAIALYEGLGYVSAARRRRYYPDNREDAVVMWLYDLQAWEPPHR